MCFEGLFAFLCLGLLLRSFLCPLFAFGGVGCGGAGKGEGKGEENVPSCFSNGIATSFFVLDAGLLRLHVFKYSHKMGNNFLCSLIL